MTGHRETVGWTVSVVAHLAVLGALVWTVRPHGPPPTVDEAPLVFIEPAPPPSDAGAAEAVPSVAPPEPVPPTVEPRRPEPPTLVEPPSRAKPQAPPTPTPRPAPKRGAPPPEPVPQPGGVPGGTPGGLPGGVVGATGTQPVPAALAGRPPVVLARVAPTYPTIARERRVEGRVVLRAVVGTDGAVEEVRVVRSVPLLDDAAVAALERWRFTPGRDRDGNVVRVLIEVPMRFALEP